MHSSQRAPAQLRALFRGVRLDAHESAQKYRHSEIQFNLGNPMSGLCHVPCTAVGGNRALSVGRSS